MGRKLATVQHLLCLVLLAGASAIAAGQAPSPPAAEKRPVTDSYHGVVVRDDYRWLEDGTASEVKSWSDDQNAYARGVLDRLPSVPALRVRLRAIAGAPSPSWSSIVRRGDALFALKNEPPRQQPFLV